MGEAGASPNHLSHNRIYQFPLIITGRQTGTTLDGTIALTGMDCVMDAPRVLCSSFRFTLRRMVPPSYFDASSIPGIHVSGVMR